MKPYPKYKDSGVEWFGQVPEGWGIKKFKYLYHSSMGNTILKSDLEIDGELPVFSATESDAIFGYVNHAEVILVNGDFVIPARGNSIGHIMLVKEKATCTQTTIYAKKYSRSIDDKFSFYYQKGLKEQLFLFDRTAIPQITVNQIKENLFVIPPISEQVTIANFLDRKTAEIDRLIANKKRLIELYEEEKTAVINQAVTKGLDPSSPMKPSGIDWLGDVPEHWEVKRLRYIVKNLESGVSVNATDLPASEEDFGVLKTSCVYDYTFNPEENKAIWPEELARAKINPRKGEVIISRMNTPELVGASGYVHQDYPNLFLPDRLWQTIFYDYGVIDTFWFSFILKCSKFRELLSITATGTSPSMKNLAQEAFLYISIPFPKKDEQTAVTEHIETECSRLETIIEKFKKQIDLLKEYRTTLISEVVTGKIDVRDEVVQ